MSYQQRIAAELLLLPGRRSSVSPAHVEAWMRSEHSTLDALSPAAFRREVRICADVALAAEPTINDQLAASYGLQRSA